MARYLKVSGLLVGLAAAALCGCLCCPCCGQDGTQSVDPSANMLTTVPPYSLDHLSGSMALHALHSALASQGFMGSYTELVGISGEVFKVVYDSSDAFEPLRDACPFDLLGTAAARRGFPNAHWETGLKGEDLRRIVKHEIDSGRPLISPFLKPDAYHGFNIITGYDYDLNEFKVQGAFDRRRAYNVPIPETWDGPTMSPAGWAANPVFVLGEAVDDSTVARNIYVDMVKQARDLLQGGTLAYGLTDGEARYMARPGPHLARYGLPAYDILAWDVEHTDIVLKRPGGDTLNFGLLWRIDAMVGLLEHDRSRGPEFGSVLRGILSQQNATALYELVVNLKRTAEDAAELRDLFWHEIPDTLPDVQAVLDYVDGSGAMVFGLPDMEGLASNLRDMGRKVYASPWGWVMVEDSPEKRVRAKMKVISLRSRETRSLDLIMQVGKHVRSTSDRSWPPRKWEGQRLNQD
jgi:hypothetical protein